MSLSPEVAAAIGRMRDLYRSHGADAASELSDSIQLIFDELEHENISELIAAAVHSELFTHDEASYILGVAMWTGVSNGSEMQNSFDRWLADAEDPIRIALALDQLVLPFVPFEKMAAALGHLAALHPQFEAKCRDLVQRRAKQHGL